MNGLTVNLHLMLVSFYRPTVGRHRVLIEDRAFPSDAYAVGSQIRLHGRSPDDALLVARPRPGEATLRTADLLELIEQRGEEVALLLLGAVNYYTGQLFDVEAITAAARRRGCVVGWDLAHAVGNVPLRLHDWDVDFAVWCSYKYLNGGPGAVGGCFVHERHGERDDLPRLAGWWGNDPRTRFRMHLNPDFEPVPGADGWQLGNPPILAMAPLRAALALAEEAGLERLRAKSVRLTRQLEGSIDRARGAGLELLTPRASAERGCQLSVRARARADELFEALRAAGIVADVRRPDVVRLAPVPLYNTFHEVWRVGRVLEEWAAAGGARGSEASRGSWS
jgi:kynureninase